MQTITLDGTTKCYATRDENGVHISMCLNGSDKTASGTVEKMPIDSCLTECDYRIDISDKSYIALVKSLLYFADRAEIVRIINNPIDGSCWNPVTRKSKRKEKKHNEN